MAAARLVHRNMICRHAAVTRDLLNTLACANKAFQNGDYLTTWGCLKCGSYRTQSCTLFYFKEGLNRQRLIALRDMSIVLKRIYWINNEFSTKLHFWNKVCILKLNSSLIDILRKYSLTLGFWTLSIVRNSITRRHNVSETGSVSVLRWGWRETYSIRSLEKLNKDCLTSPMVKVSLYSIFLGYL
jgi:hypothetical protein